MLRAPIVVSIGLVALAATSGCAPPDPPERLAQRLFSCGLLSAGEVGPSATSAFYAPSLCYLDCLAAASCDDLSGAICRTDFTLLVACDQRCAFRCDDGTLVGIERVCNRFAECAGGEDEAGCPMRATSPYTCASGEVVMGRRCDGVVDCSDRSDERCLVRYRCDDGTLASGLASTRCDGRAGCRDGSDEAGCATLVPSCGS